MSEERKRVKKRLAVNSCNVSQQAWLSVRKRAHMYVVYYIKCCRLYSGEHATDYIFVSV